jgi:hypothetical protein
MTLPLLFHRRQDEEAEKEKKKKKKKNKNKKTTNSDISSGVSILRR